MAATQNLTFVAGIQGVGKTTNGLNRLTGATSGLEQAGNKANKMFRGMRGGTQQLSYQIQDVAVQLQAGQNALLVFGQQGSQIASLMGPGGAIIGALFAVSAALATTFLGATKKAEEGFEELAEEIRNTIFDLNQFNSEFTEFLRLQNKADTKKQTEEFGKLVEKYQSGVAKLELLKRKQREYEDAMAGTDEALKSAKAINGDYLEQIEAQELANAALAAQLRKMRNEFDGVTNATKKQMDARASAAERSINASHKELDAIIAQQKGQEKVARLQIQSRIKVANNRINAGHRELDELIAADKKRQELAEREKKRLDQQIREEEAYLKQRQAFRESLSKQADQILFGLMGPIDQIKETFAREEKILNEARAEQLIGFQEHADAVAAIQQRMQMAVQVYTLQTLATAGAAISGSLEQLSNAVGKASGIGRVLFAMSKAFAVGTAIINAHLAYSNAMANIPAPYNIPIANTMLALGYANAGAIAGQAVASFEGGGISFSGVRSGGMDGKGGRMAVVHPNEKITDLEKGGMSQTPVNVTMNISAIDAKGIDKLLIERRSLITGIVNKAVNNRGRSSL